jgi:hypothetical protein
VGVVVVVVTPPSTMLDLPVNWYMLHLNYF